MRAPLNVYTTLLALAHGLFRGRERLLAIDDPDVVDRIPWPSSGCRGTLPTCMTGCQSWVFFAGSTQLESNSLHGSLPPALRTPAAELSDRALVKLLKNVHINRRLRRDVFVKDGLVDQRKLCSLTSRLHFRPMRSPTALFRR